MRCEESDRPYDENERDGKPPGKVFRDDIVALQTGSRS